MNVCVCVYMCVGVMSVVKTWRATEAAVGARALARDTGLGRSLLRTQNHPPVGQISCQSADRSINQINQINQFSYKQQLDHKTITPSAANNNKGFKIILYCRFLYYISDNRIKFDILGKYIQTTFCFLCISVCVCVCVCPETPGYDSEWLVSDGSIQHIHAWQRPRRNELGVVCTKKESHLKLPLFTPVTEWTGLDTKSWAQSNRTRGKRKKRHCLLFLCSSTSSAIPSLPLASHHSINTQAHVT